MFVVVYGSTEVNIIMKHLELLIQDTPAVLQFLTTSLETLSIREDAC